MHLESNKACSYFTDEEFGAEEEEDDEKIDEAVQLATELDNTENKLFFL